MFTLITNTNEYNFTTLEELVATANNLTTEERQSFDFEHKDIYFGFNANNDLTVEQMKEWIEEER